MTRIPQEGAWFSLAHICAETLPEQALPVRYASQGARPMSSAILALVTERDFSAMHRLRAEETWHFYDGDPMELLLLEDEGQARIVRLGRDQTAGEQRQFTVRPGTWMGARPARRDQLSYSFFGCTLAPGFEYGDYEHGRRAELQCKWPVAARWIAGLTREDNAAPAPTPADPMNHLSLASTARLQTNTGVALHELVGRAAGLPEKSLSISRFNLAAGASTGRSRYLAADEYFYILEGVGQVDAGEHRRRVAPGDVVKIPRGLAHSLQATENSNLTFLAVMAPAFDPAWFRPDPGDARGDGSRTTD